MKNNIFDIIPSDFKDYKIEKIVGGSSNRLFFRLLKNSHSVIFVDSSEEIEEYKNYIKINNYLSKINISIPNIYFNDDNNYVLILEDFGNNRFDKILNDSLLKELLNLAVQTLITINNETDLKDINNLNSYNFNVLQSEISEFIDFYCPYALQTKITNDLRQQFFYCWQKKFESISFNFNDFVHKDFNLNNLMYLNDRNNHLKCGILDFQSAFFGESCWDLFSLLEDSRIMFDNQYNNYFIEYYHKNSKQNISLKEFKLRYYFLNCSRQTRLLGRWIKLSKKFRNNIYLNFIPITKKRLIHSLNKLNSKEFILLYSKFIPDL